MYKIYSCRPRAPNTKPVCFASNIRTRMEADNLKDCLIRMGHTQVSVVEYQPKEEKRLSAKARNLKAYFGGRL